MWHCGRVAAAHDDRSVSEIRGHFIRRLNVALLRPGMYGGELALWQFLGDLAWIDKRDEDVPGTLEPRGAWSSTLVGGAFVRMFGGKPSDHDIAAAFVYADLAGMWGYLEPQRKLTGQEYSRLRRGARQWTATADRTPADVVAAFGEPSLWRSKYNPWYPMSLGYVSGNHLDPLVTFDFWQDTDWESVPRRSRFGPQPVLRNVRWRESHFEEEFTFTPTGHALRACGPR
jgi:hypothetical protein